MKKLKKIKKKKRINEYSIEDLAANQEPSSESFFDTN